MACDWEIARDALDSLKLEICTSIFSPLGAKCMCSSLLKSRYEYRNIQPKRKIGKNLTQSENA